MILTWVFSALAGFFWYVLFSPWTSGAVLFWPMMAAASGTLAALGFLAQQEEPDIYRFRFWHALAGALSALLLYGFFYIGRQALTWLLPLTGQQINDVYTIRQEAPIGVIVFLLLFWIGPAEEIFWRGFIQQRCMKHFGQWQGLALAAFIYAIVHIWSFNLTLFLAAGVCGLWWGLQFLMFRNLWPVMISHALWDVLIFVVLPLNA